ncbi:MFS transporter [Ilumatobacter sp.]|uniref:MFS transporter n=1 Tax=Ilumatobacter sp. TaxID=1967498 RepID=UPI003AF50B27
MTSSDGAAAALDRNVRLIPVHQALTRALVWLPIMVLFTRARFDLDGALLLSSLYYLFVVALEVPSGWMSDRLGRTLTLRIAAASWVVAHLCFLIGDERFGMIVLGQFFLAGGFASLSGTDVTFHYDTLEALGRADTYTRRESIVSSIGFVATAFGVLLGGVLGYVDLRLAFVAALVFAVAQFVVASMLSEPPVEQHADPFLRQIKVCVGYLSHRYLGWIFFYGIVLVTLEHVAFTLAQPWLTEVLGQTADDIGATPLLAGVVYATTAFIGAASARAVAPISERIGVVATLIGLAALSSLIVTGMAVSTSAFMIGLVAFRSAQGAAAPVLISAAVAPHAARQHRATLLSLNSLAGRLGYGLILLAVAGAANDDVLGVLRWFSVGSWTLVAVLIATAWWAIGRRPTTVMSSQS